MPLDEWHGNCSVIYYSTDATHTYTHNASTFSWSTSSSHLPMMACVCESGEIKFEMANGSRIVGTNEQANQTDDQSQTTV